MSAETAIILAHATGRTLVMPPLFKMYLAHAKDEESVSASTMLFDLSKVSEALSIISMNDFVNHVVKKRLLNTTYSNHLNSLLGRTNLWEYLSSVCKHTPAPLEPKSFFLALNITQDDSGKGSIGTFDELKGDRYQEMLIGNTRHIIPYDQAMHDERVLFVSGEGEDRMLIHFYAYLHWADPHVEQIYKRIARDRLRYRDDIFCGAGRIVKLIHRDASLLPPHLPVQSAEIGHPLTLGGDTNRDATYFAFHIRRNDFQVYYANQEISAATIWANTKHLLNSSISTLIYISTDERNKSFFAPFMQPPYTVKFLYDYEYAIQDANSAARSTAVSMNRVGMMEQVICANAHTFVGTFWSTFTGYITRMRGTFTVLLVFLIPPYVPFSCSFSPSHLIFVPTGYYRDGRYARTYYSSASNLYALQQRKYLEGTLWGREFEKAHRNIESDN